MLFPAVTVVIAEVRSPPTVTVMALDVEGP